MKSLSLRRISAVLVMTGVIGAVSGCTASLPFHRSRLSILTYNVQNLFDDHANGSEYAEYDPTRSDWGTAAYYTRLENLSSILRSAVRGGPDIVALQEIEHTDVLVDLEDRFLGGLGYRYMCAASNEGSPITIGILSRIPIVASRAHGAHVDGGYPLRPILEVEMRAGGKTITLFVCHWKSKSGGARLTEPLRLASAGAVARRIREIRRNEPNRDVIIAGDLNETPHEYRAISAAYQTALVPMDSDTPESYYDASLFIADRPEDLRTADGPVSGKNPDPVVLWSPWEESAEEGSYAFRGEWERIDHFLVSSSLFDGADFEFDSFSIVRDDRLVDGEGFPLRWQSYSLTGYSDHLPLLLDLTM